jgi:hypothetical protein
VAGEATRTCLGDYGLTMPTVVPMTVAVPARADINLRPPVQATISAAVAPVPMSVVAMSVVTMAVVTVTMPAAMSHCLDLAGFAFGDRRSRKGCC